MSLLSFLFPQTIEEVNSPINGKIKVIKYFGNISLQVDDLTQSGGLLKNVWEKGLKEIGNWKLEIGNCLVLGVGGGTVIQLINKYFPNTKIIGIEIDPQMIKLGQKYFGLRENKNLKIIVADAINWVDQLNFSDLSNNRYDIILVDLYIGKDSPNGLYDNKFLYGLKELITSNGIIVFNRLRNRENMKEIEDFIKNLKNIFPEVSTRKPLVNYLIFCSDAPLWVGTPT